MGVDVGVDVDVDVDVVSMTSNVELCALEVAHCCVHRVSAVPLLPSWTGVFRKATAAVPRLRPTVVSTGPVDVSTDPPQVRGNTLVSSPAAAATGLFVNVGVGAVFMQAFPVSCLPASGSAAGDLLRARCLSSCVHWSTCPLCSWWILTCSHVRVVLVGVWCPCRASTATPVRRVSPG